MLYSLEPTPYKVNKTEMLALGYPNPHAFSYILHPIKSRLDSFHIDLTTLLREVNHQGDNKYGQPLYLNGIQLRRFMASEDKKLSIPKVEQKQPDLVNSNYMSNQKAIHRNAYAPWTAEQESRLLQLFESECPISEIANHLERNEGSISSRLRKLKMNI